MQIHPESQHHHGTLQQNPRDAPALADVWMGEAESEKNSCRERHGWGNVSGKGKKHTKSKENFRERGHSTARRVSRERAEGQPGRTATAKNKLAAQLAARLFGGCRFFRCGRSCG